MTSTHSGENLISEENLKSTQSHSFLKEEENKPRVFHSVFLQTIPAFSPHVRVDSLHS